jgi:hypothetical protein
MARACACRAARPCRPSCAACWAGELPWRARLALLAHAARWRLSGFRCPADWSVARLCEQLPQAAFDALIDRCAWRL